MKNMTIGKKIVLGFTAVLVLLVIVAVISFYSLNGASEGFDEYRAMARDTNLAGRLQANMLQTRMNVKDFIIDSSQKAKDGYDEYMKNTREFLGKADKEIKHSERAALIDEVIKDIGDYDKGFEEVVKYQDRRHHIVNKVLDVKGPQIEEALTEIMSSANTDNDSEAAYNAGKVLRNLLLARLYVTKYLQENTLEAVERVEKEFTAMEAEMEVLEKDMENPQRRKLLETVRTLQDDYQAKFRELTTLITDRNKVIEGTLDRIGSEVAKDTEDVKLSVMNDQNDLGKNVQDQNAMAVTLVTILGIVAMVVGVVLSFLITVGINRALGRVIDGLTNSAEQTTSAAGQVSSSSQSLAEGASEQAASVEETTTSVEEMTSMTKQNAANANEAKQVADSATRSATNGTEAMGRMSTAIDDIKNSSDETAKIIKTIDEIAFQTNLLA
ncbi:MAG: methyl-accepting chemotaxis protein, partial [Phycisphaerae bacterium]